MCVCLSFLNICQEIQRWLSVFVIEIKLFANCQCCRRPHKQLHCQLNNLLVTHRVTKYFHGIHDPNSHSIINSNDQICYVTCYQITLRCDVFKFLPIGSINVEIVSLTMWRVYRYKTATLQFKRRHLRTFLIISYYRWGLATMHRCVAECQIEKCLT